MGSTVQLSKSDFQFNILLRREDFYSSPTVFFLNSRLPYIHKSIFPILNKQSLKTLKLKKVLS